MQDWLTICAVAYEKKNTVGFSPDDAGIGDLDSRTAVLYDLPAHEIPTYSDWFNKYYPGVKVIFREFPDHPIILENA